MSAFFNTLSISFYATFLIMLSMVGFKAMEMHSGRKSFISKLSDNTNHIVHNAYDRIIKSISYINRKSAIALIEWIACHILSGARKVYIWAYNKAHAHPPSKRVIDMVRGKGEVNRNGGSSIFLKKISEDDKETPP